MKTRPALTKLSAWAERGKWLLSTKLERCLGAIVVIQAICSGYLWYDRARYQQDVFSMVSEGYLPSYQYPETNSVVADIPSASVSADTTIGFMEKMRVERERAQEEYKKRQIKWDIEQQIREIQQRESLERMNNSLNRSGAYRPDFGARQAQYENEITRLRGILSRMD